MKRIWFLAAGCLCLANGVLSAAGQGGTPAVPPVIDDLKLMQQMKNGLGKMADAKRGPGSKQLQQALRKAPRSIPLELPREEQAGEDFRYDDAIASVGIIGSVYKCDKCEHWHLSGGATTWCLTADGVFVTNYHVFENTEGAVLGVCMANGKVTAVKEIIAADRGADVCLFRVDGSGFTPLRLGEPAPVGTKVRVLSHPEGRFFYQTSGEVARYHRRSGRGEGAGVTWMSVTADFAKGSSGGPVIDPAGRVVGMVSSTQSIYYESSGDEPKGPLQMVVKNCVPAQAIRRVAGLKSP